MFEFLGILLVLLLVLNLYMLKKILSVWLLSHVLLAYAADEVPSSVVRNDAGTLAQTAQAAPIASPIASNSLPKENQTDESDFNKQMLLREQASSTAAYDDLLKIMPVLGYTTLSNHPQKEELSLAVQKFAALPRMRSSIVLIYDEKSQRTLHGKNADVIAPIASITKLMTAMVVLDAELSLDEEISLTPQDINRQKRASSRTRAGMTMTRGELLKLALMASDNLSAAALARTFPGGTEAALAQMNLKARKLGMNSSYFMDATGLSSRNVSTANDLVKLVSAAREYELIHQYSIAPSHTLERVGHRPLRFNNTNPLVRNASWNIGLSKTGYISEAGRCLVMEAKFGENPVIIVLLDSWGRNSRVGDANRVKQWVEKANRS